MLRQHPYQDPLEQFEVFGLFASSIIIMFIFIQLLLNISLVITTLTKNNSYTALVVRLYFLVKTILIENLYVNKQKYFAVLFYLFLFIFGANILGLLPYSFTVTSSFIFTFFIAMTHFIGLNMVGLFRLRTDFVNLFLPAGVPTAIAPFLVLVEIISYIARVFSLSIRLFANMMSGHALLKILIGFSWSLILLGGILIILAIFPWLIVTIIMLLELLIAFLQAYVFTILVTLYLNDVLNLH